MRRATKCGFGSRSLTGSPVPSDTAPRDTGGRRPSAARLRPDDAAAPHAHGHPFDPAAASVGLFGKPRPAVELLAIGLLGLTATVGNLVYELRNSQIYAAAAKRAEELERKLGLEGGLYSDHPPATMRLLGVFPATRLAGLGLVYGAAIAGWSYLVSWGLLHAIGLGDARTVGLIVGAAVGAGVAAEVMRVH